MATGASHRCGLVADALRKGLLVGDETAYKAAEIASKAIGRAHHPVRDYLGALEWDGVRRLDTFVPEHLGGDAAIGQLVASIEAKDGFRETALLISADHGGSDRGHYRVLDPERAENVTIPWIAVGAGIPAGLKIGRVVRTFDTAPTVLALLGLGAPVDIDGRPVPEILASIKK